MCTCSALRSGEWGVMPWHWYWTSALPRMLLLGLPLWLVGGVLDARVRPMAAVAALYVALYSLLPHKEVCGGGGFDALCTL